MLTGSITRRQSAKVLLGAATAAAMGGVGGVQAAEKKSVKIGMDLSLTGADAESAKRVEYGALLAIDDANAKGGVGGYMIEAVPTARRRRASTIRPRLRRMRVRWSPTSR
jgi:ABC-type branched-subunit amino acid transport system substrate-binding protein